MTFWTDINTMPEGLSAKQEANWIASMSSFMRQACIKCRHGRHNECHDVDANDGSFDADDYMPTTCVCFNHNPEAHQEMRRRIDYVQMGPWYVGYLFQDILEQCAEEVYSQLPPPPRPPIDELIQHASEHEYTDSYDMDRAVDAMEYLVEQLYLHNYITEREPSERNETSE